jgi:hypothetical protein
VLSPKEYSSIVLAVQIAEEAAQLNLNRQYRTLTRKGGVAKKPGIVWIAPDFPPKPRDPSRKDLWEAERRLLEPCRDNWEYFA